MSEMLTITSHGDFESISHEVTLSGSVTLATGGQLRFFTYSYAMVSLLFQKWNLWYAHRSVAFLQSIVLYDYSVVSFSSFVS